MYCVCGQFFPESRIKNQRCTVGVVKLFAHAYVYVRILKGCCARVGCKRYRTLELDDEMAEVSEEGVDVQQLSKKYRLPALTVLL